MACVTAIWREQEAKKHKKEKTPWPAEPPKHGSGPPPYGYIHLASKNVASPSKFPLCTDTKYASEKCSFLYTLKVKCILFKGLLFSITSSDTRQRHIGSAVRTTITDFIRKYLSFKCTRQIFLPSVSRQRRLCNPVNLFQIMEIKTTE